MVRLAALRAHRSASCPLRLTPSGRARDRTAVGARRGDLCSLVAVRPEAPDRHRLRAARRGGGHIWGGFRRCCAGWSRPTTCPGASAAMPRTAPSSRSPATSGATCSAISSGHSPTYFAERLPGALASRISATANAAFTWRTPASWNVLPPCVARGLSIAFIGSVNLTMAARWWPGRLALGALVFFLARNGTPLHRDFAEKAAAVDGELVDIIGNFNVVRAFGATLREQAASARRWRRDGCAPRQSVLPGASAPGARGADRDC